MLYREELNELGFYSKTPSRRIYHHNRYNLLLEVRVVYEYSDYNRIKHLIIIWEAEIGVVTKKLVLFRSPDSRIILNQINPTKQDIETKLKEYEPAI